MLGQLGRFPEENEHVSIVYNQFTFEVIKAEDKVISKIKVTRPEIFEDSNDEDCRVRYYG
jgi:putative hemolysin